MLSDGQLLERYLVNRSEEAFASLVHRYGPMVLGVCRRVVANEQNAEDAFQATFLVLVHMAAFIWPHEMVGNWLYGVAYRAAAKARTMASRRHAREKQMKHLPERVASENGLWDDVLPLLDQELNALPTKFRLPIVLCDLEGETRKEAAWHLGWPEGTVAGRIAEGRSLLAKRLARHGLPVTGVIVAAMLAHDALAAVPSPLAFATNKGATLLTTGNAAATGAISARVTALTNAVLNAILISKLKSAALAIAALAMLMIGSAMLAYGQSSGDIGAETKGPNPIKIEAIETEATELQGAWTVVSQVIDGVPASEEFLSRKNQWTFAGRTVTKSDKHGTHRESSFSLDPTLARKSLDITMKPGQHPGSRGDLQHVGVNRCIYLVKGDSLTICYPLAPNATRPVKFKSDFESMTTVVVLQRNTNPADDKEKARIALLIQELLDDKFEIRAAAARQLEALGQKALPALQTAAKDALDAELRQRAAQLVQRIMDAQRPKK